MTDRLDHLVARLAAAPTDRGLEDFEGEVARAVLRDREETRRAAALAPVWAASVVLALAVGIAGGGMAAATAATRPRQFDSFAVRAQLAPSTLLTAVR